MFDPKSSKTIGYHLFLEPTDDVASELSRIIGTLAHEYNGPVFAPHVTVAARVPSEIGEENIVAKTEAIIRGIAPFPITLDEVGMENQYFRALYMKVELSKELETLHKRANEAFTLTDAGAYVPHVSLLYGNFSAEEKELVPTFALLKGVSFMVDRIHLYHTEGQTHEWTRIKEFPFTAQ